jgi:hypothetical protein
MTSPDYANCEIRLEENGFIKRHAQCLYVSDTSFRLDYESLLPGDALVCKTIDNDAYHRIAVPSKSTLDCLDKRGPQYYASVHVHKTIAPYSGTHFNLGNLVHGMPEFGGSEPFIENHCVIVDKSLEVASGELSQSVKAKATIKDLLEESGREFAVTPSQVAKLRNIWSAMMANDAVRELYEDALAHEVSCIWRRHSGHLLRCRFDCITKSGIGVDWKTCRHARILEDFWRACQDYGYALASAVYREGGEVSGITDGHPLVFVAISMVEPHEVQAVEIPLSLVERAADRITPLLEELEYRTESGDWLPAGYHQINELYFPPRLLENS